MAKSFRVSFDGGPLDGAEIHSPVEIDKVVVTTAYETAIRYEVDEVSLDAVEDGDEYVSIVLRPTEDRKAFDSELSETIARS
jgi:hypothetical protein